MAIKGLSKFVVGLYENKNGTVTYSNPTTIAKMIEYSLTVNASENNPLYADNMEAENDKGTFQNGELSMGTDDLVHEASKLILGLKQREVTFANGKKATELVYDDDAKAPYLGVGFIEQHQNNDIDSYRAVFLPKVFFNVPEQSATTKGESVEWQTPTVTGIVQRSDEVNDAVTHPWMMDAYFPTESEALDYLEHKCGKTSEETPAVTPKNSGEVTK